MLPTQLIQCREKKNRRHEEIFRQHFTRLRCSEKYVRDRIKIGIFSLILSFVNAFQYTQLEYEVIGGAFVRIEFVYSIN